METQPQKVSSNLCPELLYRNSGAAPECPWFPYEHTYLISFKLGPHLFLFLYNLPLLYSVRVDSTKMYSGS